ncbi:MAG: response regulator [Bacteroidia bacterium]|nr:response regulator [Bacteroidia bacterium]
MLNLLTNAIKYRSPERQPQVHLVSQKDQNEVTLTCQDNGLGIDLKKYGHKIFGLNQTFHGNANARGVGLFIIKNQIEAMGGSISVESEPGKGTKFNIVFNQLQNDLLKIGRLWVIDDDEIYKYSLRRSIDKTQAVRQVDTFSNGKMAVDYLTEHQIDPDALPDLILLDMDMPVMDGWEFLQEYQRLSAHLAKKAKIYVSSALLSTEDEKLLRQIGIEDSYLTKPVRTEDLLSLFRKIKPESKPIV